MTEYTTHTDGQQTSSVDSTVRDRQQQHAGSHGLADRRDADSPVDRQCAAGITGSQHADSHGPADRRDADSPVDRRDADSPAGSQTEVI
jgi:hypothetical protein